MKTDATLIPELRAALRRRGIWGARAERLMQDWVEHARDDAAQRVEKGADPEAAQQAAWRALGAHEVLAVSAARELARASWLGRHPWLGGLALPVIAWIALVVASVAIPWWVVVSIYGPPPLRETRLLDFLFACHLLAWNWLPWLCSMAWLARLSARMPGGWKLFWITTIVLTLCSTFPGRFMTSGPWGPPVPLPFPSGILGLMAIAIAHVLGSPIAALWESHIHLGPWIQTAIMLFGAITFHRKATTTRTAASAAPAG